MTEFLDRQVTDVTFESMLLEDSGRALSGRKWTSSTRAQYWRFVISLQSSWHDSPQAALRVFAHMAARRGSQAFQMPVPQPPVGSNGLHGKRLAAADLGATALGLSGAGNATVEAGRFVSFAGHAKVYIVEAATASQLTIFPGLVMAVGAGAAVDFTPDMTCQYAGLARMAFQAGRATPSLIVEEVI